jgi:FtsH-binding integral membrane protein
MFGSSYLENPLTYRDATETNVAMGRVYLNMALAVLTSMVVSMLIASSPALFTFFFTGALKWVVMFLPLLAIFGISFVLAKNPSRELALLMLHGFAAIMGLSFATIFVVFQLGSIVSAFMGAAILFGVMSFYGYFTKRSLDSVGKFMFIGLIAIIIASIINIFIGSSVMAMVISTLAIIIFTALTAYDTQKIREELQYTKVHPSAEIRGALTLYLDFINIFLSLLQLTGSKNE